MKDEMKTNPSGDLISRANAIKAIASAEPKDNEYHYYKHIAIKILSEIPPIELPKGELISRADAKQQISEWATIITNPTLLDKDATMVVLDSLPSADAKPKWNCTANFVAEQLERLKDMTDEERLKLLQKMFLSTEQKTGEWISNHDGSWNCSECGLRVFIYAKGNYCPNCGARMYKGGGDE